MRTKPVLVLLLIALPLSACGGGQDGQDVPPSLRQSDRLLGRAMAAMDRNPAAPGSALTMPDDVQAALLQSGLGDARVRAYAEERGVEQRAFDAKWKPILARAHTSAFRARRILTHALADPNVSPQFLLRYGELAKAIDAWIAAERRTANDVSLMAEAFDRATRTTGDKDNAQAFYKAVAKARASRARMQGAADRADRASAALSALLNVDGDAAEVAAVLIDVDASGFLARKWRQT
jgi:hypothetical protein